MFLRILAVLCCLNAHSVAAQGVGGREFADLHFALGQARLEHARSLLAAAERDLAARPEWSHRDGHRTLSTIMDGVTVARSMLSINRAGELEFDSYNSIRFLFSDLSDRQYVKDGFALDAGDLGIHAPVFGRQSGLMFVPVTRKTLAAPGSERLLVLTLDPQQLIPDLPVCNVCGFFVLHRGRVIAASQALSDVNEDVAARVNFEGKYGAVQLTVRQMPIAAHWRRDDLTDLIFVYYQARGVADD